MQGSKHKQQHTQNQTSDCDCAEKYMGKCQNTLKHHVHTVQQNTTQKDDSSRTIIRQCKEECIQNGDPQECLVETCVLHQLPHQPALVKHKLLEGRQLSFLRPYHTSFYTLH